MAYMKDSTGRRLDSFPAVSATEADGRYLRNAPRRRDVPSPLLNTVTEDSVMASPPTISIVSAHGITNPRRIRSLKSGIIGAGAVDTDQPFQFTGVGESSWAQQGSTAPAYDYMVFHTPDHTNNPSARFKMRFFTDVGILSIPFRQYIGYRIVVRVNGQRTHAAPITTTASPEIAYLKIDFGGVRAQRLIEVEMSLPVDGVFIPNDGTVWKAPRPGFPRVVLLGDSYTQGTGSNNPGATGYAQQLVARMGWVDVVYAAMGGSGYLNGGQGGQTFQQRIASDVIALAPDIVIIVGGHNDTTASSSAFTLSAFTAAAGQLYTSLRDALPSAILIAIGPLGHQLTAGEYPGLVAAMKTQGAGKLDAVIDTMTDPWFVGSGTTTSPAGNGNDDFYFDASDIQHPNQAGHDYMAQRIYAALADVLPR